LAPPEAADIALFKSDFYRADRKDSQLAEIQILAPKADVVAVEQGVRDGQALAEAVIPMVLDSAAHLAGSGRVRACLFRFAPGTPMMLVPAACSGRVDDPLEPVAEGTAEGELVFGMIRHNQHLFCPDLDASPPPGWRVRAPQTYKSFAAVPVAAGARAHRARPPTLRRGGAARDGHPAGLARRCRDGAAGRPRLFPARLPHLPRRARRHLGETRLGLVLLMAGAGAVAVRPLTGRLCDRLGGRAVLRVEACMSRVERFPARPPDPATQRHRLRVRPFGEGSRSGRR